METPINSTDTRRRFDSLCDLAFRVPILLEGPCATTLEREVVEFAAKKGLPLSEIDCTGLQSSADLVGKWRKPAFGAPEQWQDGPLPVTLRQALLYGPRVLLVKNLNRVSRAAALGPLHNLIGGGCCESFSIRTPIDALTVPSSRLFIVATASYLPGGHVDRALLERFWPLHRNGSR